MGCCHSHGHGDRGEKNRDTTLPSVSSLPLELDGYCSRKPHPHLRNTGTSRHSPPLPPVVAAGSTGDSSKSPPFLEEESVKEVIPESANRRPSSLMPSSLAPPPPNAAWFPPQPPDLVDRVVKINVGDEEASEIYSASESLSTSTIPEKMQEGDDWGDHKMLDRDRAGAGQSPMPTMSNNTWTSPSKFQRRSRGGGNNSSTSPNGGGDDSAAYSPSPNSSRRLEGGVRRPRESFRRPVRGGSRAGGRQMGVISRNVPAAPGPDDKRNGRIRSRSPAMRSGERHNSSTSMGRAQNADAGEDKAPPGGEADSLDNPLVSLECFIFL